MPELMPPLLALYIHIPWCVKKCPYCDFNSHGQKAELPVADYIAALTRDLEQDLPLVWGRSISSVFFGGGTPSLFSGAAIGEILSMANSRLRFAPNCEITLECNPGTVEYDRFESYLAAGVNRLSFGVQSFDDGCLERLGRIHDAERARAAVISAQDAGFANINLDLMYALPQQSLAMALNDVEQAIALNPQHLSHYQLTLEPNTLFAAKPPAGIPEMDDAWDMQEACIARMTEAGFSQYEVSAYAREGRRCQHNLNYWTYGDYLGIGAGAHGKISSGHDGRILRHWKPKHPETYIASAGIQAGIGGGEFVLPENRPFDYMLNALRLVDGFSLVDFELRTGLGRESINPQLDQAVQRGWLEISDDWAKPTELGMRFANDVMGLFLH
ncbi:MAG: radical SAM family heme chaperone HemW [Gammaproteobacteria bacterium]|jgi:putative oxygen-independent coproporphyrinogen III oxidase|nr:radical SAM family heme chaperone HemW [Xanthomonadaceae bacterium]